MLGALDEAMLHRSLESLHGLMEAKGGGKTYGYKMADQAHYNKWSVQEWIQHGERPC